MPPIKVVISAIIVLALVVFIISIMPAWLMLSGLGIFVLIWAVNTLIDYFDRV